MAKIIKYGIVGYSINQFDQETAHQILKNEFQKIKEAHPNTIIEIVSGYTNSGVPKIAYELAEKFGFVTVGFSAKQALTVSSGVCKVDKVFIIGEKFGDESEDFVQYIDALIRVGGGQQSKHETELFKKRNANKSLSEILKEFEVA